MAGTVKTETEHNRTDKNPNFFMRILSLQADAFERTSALGFDEEPGTA
jgi:hypothetical protein